MAGLRIASRGSALARAQAEQVIALLRERVPDADPELVVLRVSGDDEHATANAVSQPRAPTGARAPAPAGPQDKSRWVDAIEAALGDGDVDLAVHSAKDVPIELAEGLELAGSPARAPVADALCGAPGLAALAPGARLGTSSVRRAAQLRAAREDLEIVALAGNVDTRLRKLALLDAIVVAQAGLVRLGREDSIGALLDPATFVPAPGQGALALETRAGDPRALQAAQAISDADTLACLKAERALARELEASCHTPLGAHAAPAGCGCLHLRAWVGLPDGSAWVADELLGGFYEPAELGRDVARRMQTAGAGELLARAA